MSTSSITDQYNRMYRDAHRGIRCSDFVNELVTHLTNSDSNTQQTHIMDHSFPLHNDTYDKDCQQTLTRILKPVLETKDFKIVYGTSNKGTATLQNRKLTIE